MTSRRAATVSILLASSALLGVIGGAKVSNDEPAMAWFAWAGLVMRPSVGSSLTLPGTRRSWIKIWNDENGDTYVDWVLASRSERWSVPASV